MSTEDDDNHYYPHILEVVSDYFRLSEFERVCLFQDWLADSDDGAVTYVFPEGSQFEQANDFYGYLAFNKVLAEVAVDERFMALALLRELKVPTIYSLLFLAFTATLNAYETYSGEVIKDLYQDILSSPDSVELLALLYTLDYVITGTTLGVTYCVSTRPLPTKILPRLSKTRDAGILKLIYSHLEFLRPYSDVLEYDLDYYPEELLDA